MASGSWDFRRGIASIRIMVELGREYGLSPSGMLVGTDIAPAILDDPAAEVSAGQELRLIRNILSQVSPGPGWGITAGQRYHFTVFGALGFALVSSRSLRDALDVGLNYLGLTFAFSRFSVSDDGTQTRIDVDDGELRTIVGGVERRFIVERDIATLLTLQRDIFSAEAVLDRVCLAFPESQDSTVYENHFGIKPEFGTERHCVFWRSDVMDRPLPRANPLAQGMARRQCEILLDQRRARTGLPAEVREHLASRAFDMPTLDSVANDLNMTPRTLRRHLKTAGTTFLELREEVRQALAREYLAESRLSIERIAERLGYAEPTSFINAYKRWYGRTPNRERLSRRG